MDREQSNDRIFPVEIFKLIVDSLLEDIQFPRLTGWDYMALQRLCLVCKDFLYLARPSLYFSADIGSCQYMLGPTNRLGEVLNNHPKLCTHLRQLTYHSYFAGNAAEEERAMQEIAPGSSVLLRLPFLECISIRGRETVYQDISPNNLGLKSLMESYLPSVHLTTLHVESVKDLPIDLIFASAALQKLEIQSCELTSSISNQIVPTCRLTDLTLYGVKNVPVFTLLQPEACCYLRNVVVCRCQPARGHIKPNERWNAMVHSFRKLESVKVDGFAASWGFFKAANRAIGGVTAMFPSLKNFDLRALSGSQRPPPYVYDNILRLSSFPGLETLNIKGSQNAMEILDLNFAQCVRQCSGALKKLVIHWDVGDISNPSCVIQGIKLNMEQVPPSNVVEDIEVFIQASVKSTRGVPDVDDHIQGLNLEALEAYLLDHPSQFPQLRSVVITTQFQLRDREVTWDAKSREDAWIDFDYSNWDRINELYAPVKPLRASGDLKCEYRVDLYAPYLTRSIIRLNPGCDGIRISGTEFIPCWMD